MAPRTSTRLQQRSVPLSNVVSQSADDENTHGMSDNENTMDTAASSSTRRRGTTLMSEIWNLPSDKRITVKYDKDGNPVGKMSGKMRRFIGSAARRCELAPIGVKSWKSMPATNKDKIWIEIKKRFIIPPSMERKIRVVCLKICNSCWKAYKGKLRAEHYNMDTRTKDQIQRDVPTRIDCTQWAMCVDNWSKEPANLCKTNKINRREQKLIHRAGTKSFPEVANEMAEENDGIYPSRSKLALKVYTCKDGTFAGDVIGQGKLAKLKEKVLENPDNERAVDGEGIGWSNDDTFNEVFGEEHNGRVRGAGKGAVPSQKGVNPHRASRGLDLTSVPTTTDSNEVQELRASLALLQAQMNRFMAAQNDSGSIEARATTSSEHTPSISRRLNSSQNVSYSDQA